MPPPVDSRKALRTIAERKLDYYGSDGLMLSRGSQHSDDGRGSLSTAAEALTVSAIVVYFRTPTQLKSCLDSLRKQTHRLEEIVVVDNSSAIDAADTSRDAGDDWKWLQMAENVGFAAACNAGAARTRADFMLFLNADVQLEPTACDKLLRCISPDSKRAIVGPRIYDAAGRIELSARSFPSAMTGVLGRNSAITRLLRRIGITPSAVSGATTEWATRSDWVSGACMMLRREAFDEAGGFDEGYWMYWEDADLCRHLAQLGYESWFEPAAVGCHATGSSGQSERSVRAFHESAARYFERHLARSRLSAALVKLALAARCRLAVRRAHVMGKERDSLRRAWRNRRADAPRADSHPSPPGMQPARVTPLPRDRARRAETRT